MQARTFISQSPYISGAFDVASGCVSATYAGGEFYDVFDRVSGGCAFVLGNAGGRGIQPAWLMDVMHEAVRSSCWMESPAQHESTTSRINRLLCARAEQPLDATMFWAYFDAANQLLRYINAGHVPPLIFKSDRRKTLLRLRAGGPVLGLLPQLLFQQGAVRLYPGDLLILYSEGIINATDPSGQYFGEERLRRAAMSCLDKTAREIRARILSSLRAFTRRTAPQNDQPLLVVRYVGSAAETAEDIPGVKSWRTLPQGA